MLHISALEVGRRGRKEDFMMVDSGNNPKQLRQQLPRKQRALRPTLLVEHPAVLDAISQVMRSSASVFRGTPLSQEAAPESQIPPQPYHERSGRRDLPHSTCSSSIGKILQQLVTAKEVAQDIGVTTMTLWRWERQGRLTVYRIGREVLVEKAEVERLRKDKA